MTPEHATKTEASGRLAQTFCVFERKQLAIPAGGGRLFSSFKKDGGLLAIPTLSLLAMDSFNFISDAVLSEYSSTGSFG